MNSLTKFALLLFLNLPLAAEPTKLSLRTLSLVPVEMPEFHTLAGNGLVPLKFSHIEPSKPALVDRLEGGLPIYTGPTVPEDGSPPPHLVKLPGEAKSILLIAWMGEGNKPQFLAFPDDTATAGRKDWMVINATSKHIAMQIGKDSKPLSVKAGSQQGIRVDVPANVGSAVTIAAMLEDSWKPFYTNYWAIYEDKRCLILIVQNGEKMTVRQIFEDIAKNSAPLGKR
jgi:hypothetical protein